jgi:hypothetical protein
MAAMSSFYDQLRPHHEIEEHVAIIPMEPLHLFHSRHYFVRMCFSFLAEYKKLLAYALGVKARTLGSCTKYS